MYVTVEEFDGIAYVCMMVLTTVSAFMYLCPS